MLGSCCTSPLGIDVWSIWKGHRNAPDPFRLSATPILQRIVHVCRDLLIGTRHKSRMESETRDPFQFCFENLLSCLPGSRSFRDRGAASTRADNRVRESQTNRRGTHPPGPT